MPFRILGVLGLPTQGASIRIRRESESQLTITDCITHITSRAPCGAKKPDCDWLWLMRHLSVTSEPLSSPGQTRLVTFSLFSFPHHSISPQHRELKLEKPARLRLHILRRQCCLPAVAAFIFPQIPEEKRSTIVSPL